MNSSGDDCSVEGKAVMREVSGLDFGVYIVY